MYITNNEVSICFHPFHELFIRFFYLWSAEMKSVPFEGFFAMPRYYLAGISGMVKLNRQRNISDKLKESLKANV